MSIAKRKDGRFIVKYKDSRGVWQQRSFRDEAEARRFDGEAAYDEIENERPTVLECVLAFLDNTRHSPKVVSLYRFLILGYDRKDGTHTEGPAEILASRYADTLTFRDLNTVRDNCRARNMKDATVNVHTGRLKAALNWCASHDMLERNPWGKYDNLPAKHESWQGSLEDFQKIYAALPAWMQWACRTALALCLRPGMVELFGLRWKAFRWQQKCVSVHMGKTDSTKTVYPPEDYLSEAWARFVADGQDGTKIVCPNRKGNPVRSRAYASDWRRAEMKAGVKMPMYAIRHIAASQMLAAGADLAAVAAQLGHRDLTTTGRFYAHALPSAQRAAGSALSLVQLGAAGRGNANKNS